MVSISSPSPGSRHWIRSAGAQQLRYDKIPWICRRALLSSGPCSCLLLISTSLKVGYYHLWSLRFPSWALPLSADMLTSSISKGSVGKSSPKKGKMSPEKNQFSKARVVLSRFLFLRRRSMVTYIGSWRMVRVDSWAFWRDLGFVLKLQKQSQKCIPTVCCHYKFLKSDQSWQVRYHPRWHQTSKCVGLRRQPSAIYPESSRLWILHSIRCTIRLGPNAHVSALGSSRVASSWSRAKASDENGRVLFRDARFMGSKLQKTKGLRSLFRQLE